MLSVWSSSTVGLETGGHHLTAAAPTVTASLEVQVTHRSDSQVVHLDAAKERERTERNQRERSQRASELKEKWRMRLDEGKEGGGWEMKSKRAWDGETGVSSQAEKTVSLYKRSPLSD